VVFYHKVCAEPGLFNFRSVGSSIAVWSDLDTNPTRPVVRPGSDYPTMLFTAGEPSFGDAALVVGNTVYAYGCDLVWIAKPCRLGRVMIDDVLDRSAWQFYAGDGNWVSDVGEASPLFDGADIMSVSYNAYLDRYVAVYSEPLGTDVVMRTAARPEGPWTAATRLFRARASVMEPSWVYDAVMHPEFESDNGRTIYVTYTRQLGSFASELRVVAVELQPIG